MGERTEIAWTDATWNPWVGCRKVSEACANCYMYRDSKRYGNDPTDVHRTSPATFNSPLKWAKRPDVYTMKRVFTCSWSDFFIEEADPWRDEAWDIIRRTPQFVYQILTKRPERISQCLPADWCGGWQNVWLGVTMEANRHRARAWNLLKIPAAIYFLSIEPMLEEIDTVEPELFCKGWRKQFTIGRYFDWAICGCESGPSARETKIEWVRSLRNQCDITNTPFFLKQLMIGGKLVTTPELDGQRWTQFPEVRG